MSIKEIEKRAAAGDAAAQWEMGQLLNSYDGDVPRNHIEAEKWFLRAAEQGYVAAEVSLGDLFESHDEPPQDLEKACGWYRKAAERGYAPAQYALADCLAGWCERPQEALKWFRMAAETGHTQAACDLGNIYFQGTGVPKNYAEAFKWFLKAAEQGEVSAFQDVGSMYADGKGVAQNGGEALKWLLRIADPRNTEDPFSMRGAQITLASMYALGEAIPIDNIEAYKWLNLAAAYGVQEAAQGLDRFAQRMSRQEIEEAQKRSAELFTPGI